MNGQPATSLAFPKPGPAVWTLLAVTAALGVFTAFLATWVPGAERLFLDLACRVDRAFAQPWRLVTSGLLTDPEHPTHLLFSLMGIYFLSPPLERRWGSRRFAVFAALAIVLGNLATLAVGAVVPPDAQARFHPEILFGPGSLIVAIAVAWSREYSDAIVNLLFVLPVRGRTLLWATIGWCVIDLIYPAGLPEGVVAPFGGIVCGLLLGGSPSLVRSAWLRLRLLILRRRASTLRVEDILSPKPKRRPRPGAPALRVLSGGIDEVLKKRTPPKDKRYLN
jgi:membrane associated rhomboid family serine protease